MTHPNAAMILILSASDRPDSVRVFEALTRQGHRAAFYDPTTLPLPALGFSANTPSDGFLTLPDGIGRVALSEIQAVYCRFLMDYVDYSQVPVDDPDETFIYYQELRSGLGSFLRSLDCLWVDSLETFARHFFKNHQIKQLRAAGLTMPDSLVTNDPDAAVAFCERHGFNVIYKPCWEGAYTRQITPADLTPERLSGLRIAPVNFQECIAGTDILVHCIDGEPFAAEARSEHLDFRKDDAACYVPLELPESVIADCRTMAQVMQSHFVGVDLRRTPDGRYVFFEGTPSPRFGFFEDATGYPLTERLCRLLVHGTRFLGAS